MVPSNPIDSVLEIEYRQKLSIVLRCLIDRCHPEQQIVLKLLYGILDGRCYGPEEIALLFNVSKEDIEQIEQDAILFIQKTSGIGYLKDKFFL